MTSLDKSNPNINEQYYNEPLGRSAPENYERYFVPVIAQPLAEDLVRMAMIQPREHVLDVACGTGIVARLASQEVNKRGAVCALDINPGMLAVARTIPLPGQPIAWSEASAEDIPFPDETFDVAFCQLSLQFMENKSAALNEIRRTLVPGGRFYLNVPGPAGGLFNIFIEELAQHVSPEAAGFASRVFSLHSTSDLQQLMEGTGYHRIDIRADTNVFSLPSPKEFLWQYIQSTPLVGMVTGTGNKTQQALERSITARWQRFEQDGEGMAYKQRIITLSARKKKD
ncbi:class I SAM-dependent methyltransferase [Fodinibius sediminis]|uniref:Ubiquinone/menaquinone biosynthesis C-methylase UbiE n=1 Tax=Fodinibius sediminis TaxID=1214077 RepID=A0A521AQJ4_9BACT|nr:methyltransferase domain-containing protein [Fodinibius sediminis]SMO37089.1 Ubiquinone/menaquinone biosynthesis C-methylase UbiE [Fodinibius sediminis]